NGGAFFTVWSAVAPCGPKRKSIPWRFTSRQGLGRRVKRRRQPNERRKLTTKLVPSEREGTGVTQRTQKGMLGATGGRPRVLKGGEDERTGCKLSVQNDLAARISRGTDKSRGFPGGGRVDREISHAPCPSSGRTTHCARRHQT